MQEETKQSPRRILAIVLNQLLCELAEARLERGRKLGGLPLGVTLVERAIGGASAPKLAAKAESSETAGADREDSSSEELQAKTVLHAVNRAAQTYGVYSGQTIAEARSVVSYLKVVEVTHEELHASLQRVAESIVKFGPTVAYEAPDTVWVDITGVAHLFDGETALAQEVADTISDLGHQARFAIASGPRLAQAFAKWSTPERQRVACIVEEHELNGRLEGLPIQALPVGSEIRAWLARLGLVCFGDLARLPRKELAARLGKHAAPALSLIDGIDIEPLDAYKPRALPAEAWDWDEPIAGLEPLLFALRRVCSRIGSRLEGRGLGATALRLSLRYDAALARIEGCAEQVSLNFQFATPLLRADDLWRILSARLGSIELAAPTVGMELQVLEWAPVIRHQLGLSAAEARLDSNNPERLAVLLGQLEAELGSHSFGTLTIANSHRPEKRSILRPVRGFETSGQRERFEPRKKRRSRSGRGAQQSFESMKSSASEGEAEPSRLLAEPIPIEGPLRRGSILRIGSTIYSLKQLSFHQRLEGVEWWSGRSVSRDYLKLYLENGKGAVLALAFVDRQSRRRYLHGVYD